MTRVLTRDTERAVLAGVAAGFARYFDVDPIIPRLAFVVLAFLHGVGFVLYAICWVIVPKGLAPENSARGQGSTGEPSDSGASSRAGEPGGSPVDRFVDEVRTTGEKVVENIKRAEREQGRGQMIGGAVLVAIGLIFLLPRLNLWFWPHWLNIWDLWPAILIVLGASMLLRARPGRS